MGWTVQPQNTKQNKTIKYDLKSPVFSILAEKTAFQNPTPWTLSLGHVCQSLAATCHDVASPPIFILQRWCPVTYLEHHGRGEFTLFSPGLCRHTAIHTSPWLHPMITSWLLFRRMWKAGRHQSSLYMLYPPLHCLVFPLFPFILSYSRFALPLSSPKLVDRKLCCKNVF